MNSEPSADGRPDPIWIKSSFSGTSGDNCVEVADCEQTVRIRDSKDKSGPVLDFPRAAWTSFLELVTDR